MLLWTWVCEYLFRPCFQLFLDIYPEVGFLDHMVVLFLIFWRTAIQFSMAAIPFYIPTTGAQGFQLRIPANTCCFYFSTAAILMGVRWYLVVALTCISLWLMTSSIFSYAYWHFVHIWKNVYCPFLSQVIWFFCCWIVVPIFLTRNPQPFQIWPGQSFHHNPWSPPTPASGSQWEWLCIRMFGESRGMFGCCSSGTGGDAAGVQWVEPRDTVKDPTMPEQPPQQRSIWPGMLNTLSYIFQTKVRIAKAMIFSVVMYESESWTIKKTEYWRTDAFEQGLCRRLLRVSWTARRSNQSILKEINPEYSLEGLMLKIQYFGHLTRKTDSLGKTLMLGRTEVRRRREWQRMRWLCGITEPMDVSLSKLREAAKDREASGAAARGVTKSQTQLSNWTTTTILHYFQTSNSSTRYSKHFALSLHHFTSQNASQVPMRNWILLLLM